MTSSHPDINHKVWANALVALGQQLGQTEVERWFADTQFRGIRNRTATLVVPSRLHSQWIRENHLKELCKVLSVNDCKFIIEEPDELTLEPEDASTIESSAKAPQEAPAKTFKRPSEPIEMPERLVLNKNYVFDNFIVGGANLLAHASALGVAEGKATGFNPLFLHGSVGLGKTHLLQAIAHHRLEKDPGLRIVFLSCEQFVNHFIQALQQGNINTFRKRYRNADMLIVDDIQLLMLPCCRA